MIAATVQHRDGGPTWEPRPIVLRPEELRAMRAVAHAQAWRRAYEAALAEAEAWAREAS